MTINNNADYSFSAVRVGDRGLNMSKFQWKEVYDTLADSMVMLVLAICCCTLVLDAWKYRALSCFVWSLYPCIIKSKKVKGGFVLSASCEVR